MRLHELYSIRTFALGRMLPNLPCQLCDLLPVAITPSSIEKVKVVPSFVWLSLLHILLVGLSMAIERVY